MLTIDLLGAATLALAGVTFLLVVVTAVGLIMTRRAVEYAGRQLADSRDANLGNFLLHLDERFDHYADVHTKLRPGGAWSRDSAGPSTVEDWVRVEGYMGLFERVEVLLRKNILDLATVEYIYGYRVMNLSSNAVIRRAKLEGESTYWRGFIRLRNAIEDYRRRLTPTLVTVAETFSGMFRDLQHGKEYSGAEVLAGADESLLVRGIEFVKESGGIYLVQTRDTHVPLYQFLSRRCRPRPHGEVAAAEM